MSRGERWGKQCAPKPTPSAAQPQLSVCVWGGTAPHRPMLAPPLPAACASGAALAIQGGHKNGKQLLTARRLGSILLLLPPPPPPPQMRASIHRLSQTARRVGRRASGVGRRASGARSRKLPPGPAPPLSRHARARWAAAAAAASMCGGRCRAFFVFGGRKSRAGEDGAPRIAGIMAAPMRVPAGCPPARRALENACMSSLALPHGAAPPPKTSATPPLCRPRESSPANPARGCRSYQLSWRPLPLRRARAAVC